MAVGRSSSGSERAYSATSLAWVYLGCKNRDSIIFDPNQGLTSPKAARGGSLGRPVGLVLRQVTSGTDGSRLRDHDAPIGSDPVEPESYPVDSR
jgi:hypothetical protein